MSEWGVGEGDEGVVERTSFEYRELFLDDGIRYERFKCPYCGVRLTPVNIYATGEMARSPHFRAALEDHRFGCDGSPEVVIRPGDVQSQEGRRVEPRTLRLPEELVARRDAPRVSINKTKRESTLPDSLTVAARRRSAGERLGPAIYRTSLVRSVALAYLGILKEAYRTFPDGETESARRKKIKEDLSSHPLRLLDGWLTTYQGAFRAVRFEPIDRPRIYHGSGQVVHFKGWDRSGVGILCRTERAIAGTAAHPVDALIIIQWGERRLVSRSQDQLVDLLLEAADDGASARWFAYGTMKFSDSANRYQLDVESLDHLYIHHLEKHP